MVVQVSTHDINPKQQFQINIFKHLRFTLNL